MVAQLREEVIEHKEQLKVWQDSFLRADRERSSLSVRLQEVVEVLQSVPRHSSSIDTAPMTPVSRYADDAESSAYQSASTSRPGTTKLPLSPPDHDTPAHHQPAKAYRRTANTTVVTKTPMRHETAAREPKPKPWPLPSTSSSTPRDITQPSTSRVIRHVTAVVRVKREEDASDDERLRAPPSRSQSVYEEEVVQRHRTRERSSAAKRRIIYDEDYEEAEQDSAGESDEEDDPLMMGVEVSATNLVYYLLTDIDSLHRHQDDLAQNEHTQSPHLLPRSANSPQIQTPVVEHSPHDERHDNLNPYL